MARGGPDWRWALTLGGQAPRAAGALILAMVAATVLGGISPALASLLALVVRPGAGLADALELWRLLTWPFYQPVGGLVLLDLLFCGLSLVWLGRQLSFAWSERRFLVRFLTLSAGAAAATWLLLWPLGLGTSYAGMWPVVNALLVTWGLIFPRQQVAWFGAIQMSGAAVARLVTFGTPVFALVMGGRGGILDRLVDYVPHMAAVALAWLLVAGGPRRAWFRGREWWQRRTLERQRRRFKVVTTDRPPPRQWMN